MIINTLVACTMMMASWYGSEAGSVTASGQRYNPSGYSAAHKTLPFGTKLNVSYNGRTVQVVVNDRGPFVKGRSLDLSKGAAKMIGLDKAGVGVVKVCP